MDIRTIEWKKGRIKLIDQTRLPQRLEYIYIDNVKTLWQAIKELKVRGAPALGVAAALGVFLGVKDAQEHDFNSFKKRLDEVSKYIASSRPTARNLFGSIERVAAVAMKNKDKPVAQIKKTIFEEAAKIIEEDRSSCRRIGYFGAKLINSSDAILTVCNAGILATVDYGTALGVIYRAKNEGKKIKVFACETRPLLQGARLTAWELKKKGVDVTLICDNMAAALMGQGRIDKVIAGADRIAANGDTANKIGTYSLAILSCFHKLPFYIAAPSSTFDLSLKRGKDIPIEQRKPYEVTNLFFRKPILASGVKVFNPAFDVTPANLISAIITEKGIIYPPFIKNIPKVLGR